MRLLYIGTRTIDMKRVGSLIPGRAVEVEDEELAHRLLERSDFTLEGLEGEETESTDTGEEE